MGERKVFERIKDIKPSPGPLDDEMRYYQQIIQKFSEPRPQRFVDSKGTHIIKTAWGHVGNYMEILENVSKNINVKHYLAEYSKRKNRKPVLKYLTDLNQDDFKNIKIPHPDPTFYKPNKMSHKMYMKKLYNLNVLKLPPKKSNLKGINDAASMQPSISSLYKIILRLRDFGLASDALRENDAALRTYTLTIRRLFYILVFIKDQIKNVAKQDNKLKELLEELTLRTDDSSSLLSKFDVKKYVLRAQAMLKERQQLEELATITSSALLEKAKNLKILRGNKTNIDEITASDVPFFPKHPKYIPWETIMKLTSDNDGMIKDVKKALQTSVDALLNREESINVLMEVPFADDPKGSEDPDKESLEFKKLRPDERRELREIVRGAFNGILGDKESEITVYDKDTMAKKLTGNMSDDLAESKFLDILHKANIPKTNSDAIQEAAHYTSGLTSPSTGSDLLPYAMFTSVNFDKLGLVEILENERFYVRPGFNVTPGRTTNITEITDLNMRTIAEILKGNNINASTLMDNLSQIMKTFDDEIGPKDISVKPLPITEESKLLMRYKIDRGEIVSKGAANIQLYVQNLSNDIGIGELLITKIQNILVELVCFKNPSTNIRPGTTIDIEKPAVKLDIAKFLSEISPINSRLKTNFIFEVLIGIVRIGNILQPIMNSTKKSKANSIMNILLKKISDSEHGGYEWKPNNFTSLKASTGPTTFLKGGGNSNLKIEILDDILQNIDKNNKINLNEYIKIGEFVDDILYNQTGGEVDIPFSEAPPIVLDGIIKYNANLFSPRNNDAKKITQKDMIVKLKKTLNQKIDSKLSNDCLQSEAPGLYKALTYLRSPKGMRHLLDRVSVVFPEKVLTESDYLMAGSELNFNNGVGLNIDTSSLLDYIQEGKCNDYKEECSTATGDAVYCNNVCQAKIISDNLFFQNPEDANPTPNYYFNGMFVNYILTRIIEEVPNLVADYVNSEYGVRGFAYKKLVKYVTNLPATSLPVILGKPQYDSLKFKKGSSDTVTRGIVGEQFALDNYLDRIKLMKPPNIGFEDRLKLLLGIDYPQDLKDDSKTINDNFKVKNNLDKYITIKQVDLNSDSNLSYSQFAGVDSSDITKQKKTPLADPDKIVNEFQSLLASSPNFLTDDSLKFFRQAIIKILKPMIVFTNDSDGPVNNSFINNQYKSDQYKQLIIDIFTINYLYKFDENTYHISNLANDLKNLIPGIYHFFKLNRTNTNYPSSTTLWSPTGLDAPNPDIRMFMETANIRDIEGLFREIGSPMGPMQTPKDFILSKQSLYIGKMTVNSTSGKLFGGGVSNKIMIKNNKLYYQLGSGTSVVLPKEFKDWLMSKLEGQVKLGLVPTQIHRNKMLSFMKSKNDVGNYIKIDNKEVFNKIVLAFAQIFTQNIIIIEDNKFFQVNEGSKINVTDIIMKAIGEKNWSELNAEGTKLQESEYLVSAIYKKITDLSKTGKLNEWKVSEDTLKKYEKTNISLEIFKKSWKDKFIKCKTLKNFRDYFISIKSINNADPVIKNSMIEHILDFLIIDSEPIKEKWIEYINTDGAEKLDDFMNALKVERKFTDRIQKNHPHFGNECEYQFTRKGYVGVCDTCDNTPAGRPTKRCEPLKCKEEPKSSSSPRGYFKKKKKKHVCQYGGTKPEGVTYKDKLYGFLAKDKSLSADDLKEHETLYKKCKEQFNRKIQSQTIKLDEDKNIWKSLKGIMTRKQKKLSCGSKLGTKLFKHFKQEQWCNEPHDPTKPIYIKKCKKGTLKKANEQYEKEAREVDANIQTQVQFVKNSLDNLDAVPLDNEKQISMHENFGVAEIELIIYPLSKIIQNLTDENIIPDNPYFIKNANKILSRIRLDTVTLNVDKKIEALSKNKKKKLNKKILVTELDITSEEWKDLSKAEKDKIRQKFNKELGKQFDSKAETQFTILNDSNVWVGGGFNAAESLNNFRIIRQQKQFGGRIIVTSIIKHPQKIPKQQLKDIEINVGNKTLTTKSNYADEEHLKKMRRIQDEKEERLKEETDTTEFGFEEEESEGRETNNTKKTGNTVSEGNFGFNAEIRPEDAMFRNTNNSTKKKKEKEPVYGFGDETSEVGANNSKKKKQKTQKKQKKQNKQKKKKKQNKKKSQKLPVEIESDYGFGDGNGGSRYIKKKIRKTSKLFKNSTKLYRRHRSKLFKKKKSKQRSKYYI